jgi:hypothetical protein
MEFDQTVDFSKFKTFAIRAGELKSKNPALNSDLVKRQIDNDIKPALEARGLTEVSGRSDLNIRYHFGTSQRGCLYLALREKIETDPGNPVYLKTVQGAGYLFESCASRETG